MPDNTSVPGTVWATGNNSLTTQLRDRYVGATRKDAARVSPIIARHIITSYTRPGDTVVDPDAGAGIVVCEAIRTHRHAIGIHGDNQQREVFEANLDLAHLATPHTTATVLRDADDPRAAGLPGAVDLVLTGLRRSAPGEHLAGLARTYELLDTIADWVWPGGHIVIVCRPERDHHRLVDGSGQIIEAAQAVGLRLVDHCIALTGKLVGDLAVHARASRQETRTAARSRECGTPVAVNAHVDVLVFGVSADAGAERRSV
jgi:modification methylase